MTVISLLTMDAPTLAIASMTGNKDFYVQSLLATIVISLFGIQAILELMLLLPYAK